MVGKSFAEVEKQKDAQRPEELNVGSGALRSLTRGPLMKNRLFMTDVGICKIQILLPSGERTFKCSV